MLDISSDGFYDVEIVDNDLGGLDIKKLVYGELKNGLKSIGFIMD